MHVLTSVIINDEWLCCGIVSLDVVILDMVSVDLVSLDVVMVMVSVCLLSSQVLLILMQWLIHSNEKHLKGWSTTSARLLASCSKYVLSCFHVKNYHFSGRLLRLNKAGLIVRPYIRPLVHKKFFNLNKIWCVGRGWIVIHDSMPYDLIQGQDQGHGDLKVLSFSQICMKSKD